MDLKDKTQLPLNWGKDRPSGSITLSRENATAESNPLRTCVAVLPCMLHSSSSTHRLKAESGLTPSAHMFIATCLSASMYTPVNIPLQRAVTSVYNSIKHRAQRPGDVPLDSLSVPAVAR